MNHLRLTLTVGLSCLLGASPARAWDSVCYQYPDQTASVESLSASAPPPRGCDGVEAAHGRWRDPVYHLDEHRELFALAAMNLGLDVKSLLETQQLAVYTSGAIVPGTSLPSVWPSSNTTGPLTAQLRGFSIDEMAELPDFSYTLWDWAEGNEACPVDPSFALSSPLTCHEFETHMGATNSNHFPPQSDQWYAYYHKLAIARADQCAHDRGQVWDRAPSFGETSAATDARLVDYWKACEVEALTYEAIGQHYLQDSWSAGHMWQRWGSSDLSMLDPIMDATGGDDAPAWNGLAASEKQLLIAQVVAAVAGTIHGSEAFTFEEMPVVTTHDPLCYPDDNVVALDASGGSELVVGDLHLHDVTTETLYPWVVLPAHTTISGGTTSPVQRTEQGRHLLDCVTGSLFDVYHHLADPKGRFPPTFGPVPAPVRFDQASCAAPRVTNRAFLEGMSHWSDPALGASFMVRATAKLYGLRRGQALAGGLASLFSDSLLRSNYQELYVTAQKLAKDDPNGTQLANLVDAAGNPFRMLGVGANGAYATGGPPTSQLAEAADSNGVPVTSPYSSTLVGAVSMAFHMSHAPALCDSDPFVSQTILATRAQARRMPPGPARTALCQACAVRYAPQYLQVAGQRSLCQSFTQQPFQTAPCVGSGDLNLCYASSSYLADLRSPATLFVGGEGLTDPVDLSRLACCEQRTPTCTNFGCAGFEIYGDAGVAGARITVTNAGTLSPAYEYLATSAYLLDLGSTSLYDLYFFNAQLYNNVSSLPGLYLVTPSKAGCTFSPPSQVIALDLTTPEAFDVNFAASCTATAAPLAQPGGRVPMASPLGGVSAR